MDGETAPDTAEVWADATSGSALLPVVAPSREVAVRESRDLADVAARTALGLVDALVSVLATALGRPEGPVRAAGDVALGAAWQGYRASSRVLGAVASTVAPVTHLVVDPPLVPRRLRLRTLADGAASAWDQQRPAAQRQAGAARDVVVPAAVDVALAPVDLTGLVLQQVDLEAVVGRVLDQLDLTQLVLDRVELRRIVTAALDDLDLTELVLDRVELEPIVTRALDQLDLTQLVRDRVDLAGIAEEVIDAVDLPEIIRSSTGSVASEAVRTIRMQSIDADEGVQRIVDRIMLRRRARRTDAPGSPEDYRERGSSTPDDDAGPGA